MLNQDVYLRRAAKSVRMRFFFFLLNVLAVSKMASGFAPRTLVLRRPPSRTMTTLGAIRERKNGLLPGEERKPDNAIKKFIKSTTREGGSGGSNAGFALLSLFFIANVAETFLNAKYNLWPDLKTEWNYSGTNEAICAEYKAKKGTGGAGCSELNLQQVKQRKAGAKMTGDVPPPIFPTI